MATEPLLTKKRRGPAPTGKGELIGVRLQPELLIALDDWISWQPKPRPSRPEAVRRLLSARLAGEHRKVSRTASKPSPGKGPAGARSRQPKLIANPDEVKGG